MVQAKFTSEMIDCLRKLIGESFVSYDGAIMNQTAYGNLQLNTEHFSVELRNEVHPFSLFSEVILALKNLRAFDNHIGQRTVILVGFHERNLLNDVKALDHLAEDRHRAIQMGHASNGLVNLPTIGRNHVRPHRG